MGCDERFGTASEPDDPIRRDNVEVEDKGAVMSRVRDSVLDEYDDATTLDGVRVDLGDGWFLLRASGTQPLIRITAEAREEARADEVLAAAREILTDARE